MAELVSGFAILSGRRLNLNYNFDLVDRCGFISEQVYVNVYKFGGLF